MGKGLTQVTASWDITGLGGCSLVTGSRLAGPEAAGDFAFGGEATGVVLSCQGERLRAGTWRGRGGLSRFRKGQTGLSAGEGEAS